MLPTSYSFPVIGHQLFSTMLPTSLLLSGNQPSVIQYCAPHSPIPFQPSVIQYCAPHSPTPFRLRLAGNTERGWNDPPIFDYQGAGSSVTGSPQHHKLNKRVAYPMSSNSSLPMGGCVCVTLCACVRVCVRACVRACVRTRACACVCVYKYTNPTYTM